MRIKIRRKRRMIYDKGKRLMLSGVANSILRRKKEDLNIILTSVSDLADDMQIAILEGNRSRNSDAVLWDFSFAPGKRPKSFLKHIKRNEYKFIKVDKSLDEPTKLFMIAAVIAIYETVDVSKDELEKHKKEKEIRAIALNKRDLNLPELEPIKFISLCLVMPDIAVYEYINNNKLSVKGIINDINELNKFCLTFTVTPGNALERLKIIGDE